MVADLKEKIGFRPSKNQQAILDSKARNVVICAGRRFGKSSICAFVALRTIIEADQKGKPARVWIVAPTYELSQKVFAYLVLWFLKLFPQHGGSISYRPLGGTGPQLKTPKGSEVICKSAENPTSLLGEEVDLEIVDEAPRIPKRVYQTYLFPTTASRLGRTFFIGTPFGLNWFWEEFQKAKKEGGAFQFTSRDNPYFPEGEWERAKVNLPEQVFKQEYEASFLPDAASLFRGVKEIIKDDCLKDSIVGRTYVMGVDLGKHEDFTVLTVIDKVNHNVVYWDRFRQIDYPFQKKRIKAVAQRYNNARIIIDSTAVGEPIMEDLEREGLFVDDFRFTNKSKKELIEKESIYIEQKQVWIPPEETLIDELEAFGYHLSDAGNVIYRAPQGLHDDCVISLGLAIWGLIGKPSNLSPIQEEILKERLNKKVTSFI